MAKQNNFSQTSLTLSKEDFTNFKRLFPGCFTHFVRRCVKLALNNRSFFEQVFWSEEVL